jgi:hypothetical protein
LQKNVGTLDALIRITLGLVGLAYCASAKRRRFPLCLAIHSALKVAEGVTRFCPIIAIFGKENRNLS